MQRVLSEPKLKLKHATETHWLRHEDAVDALRRSLKAVRATLQAEADKGMLQLEAWHLKFLHLTLLWSFVTLI